MCEIPTKLCQYCRSEIPKDASVCPVCKRKQTKTISMILGGMIAGLIFSAIIIFAVFSGESEDNPTYIDSGLNSSSYTETYEYSQQPVVEPQQPVVVTPQPSVDFIFGDVMDLIEEYKDNEVAAELKYGGKTVQFTGIVKGIGKDFLDDVYVTIGDGTEITWDYAQCYFKNKDEIEKVSTLHEGDTVTVTGKVGSYTLSLSVKKCEIVEN